MIWRLTLIAALAALAAGCTAPASPRAPSALPRVVSLNPCTDAILAEVADPGQILAISHYSRDPHASSMDPATAGRFAVTRGSVEEVLALQPDLVLSSSFTDPATIRAYERLGLRLERIGLASTVAQSREQIRQIARLVGHPQRGEMLIARINQALRQAAPRPGSQAIPAVVWQSGGLVPDREALIGELLQATGFSNQARAGQTHYVSLEQMLASPPQVLFVFREGGATMAGSDRLRFHPALARLTDTRRVQLDARLLFCAGPTIIATADRLAQVRSAL